MTIRETRAARARAGPGNKNARAPYATRDADQTGFRYKTRQAVFRRRALRLWCPRKAGPGRPRRAFRIAEELDAAGLKLYEMTRRSGARRLLLRQTRGNEERSSVLPRGRVEDAPRSSEGRPLARSRSGSAGSAPSGRTCVAHGRHGDEAHCGRAREGWRGEIASLSLYGPAIRAAPTAGP